MEWIGIRTHKYKLQARGCWHHWFAWHPVVVHTFPDGAVKRIWLKKVLRKGDYVMFGLCDCGWVYKHKEIKNGL